MWAPGSLLESTVSIVSCTFLGCEVVVLSRRLGRKQNLPHSLLVLARVAWGSPWDEVTKSPATIAKNHLQPEAAMSVLVCPCKVEL